MPEKDAIRLDNFFPRTTDVMLRKGYANHVTGLTGAVDTLLAYNGLTASSLFAAANNAIYNVTTSGAVGAAVVSGFTSNRWQYVNFGTAGGQFLIAVNGSDAPINYNGTTWQTTPAITGFTSANAIHINVFKTRVFFVEKNTLKAWYLPVNSIGGSAASLDFSAIFKLGGYLMAMATWTVDGGQGMDDHAVWISSEGEVAVYKGTDPSSASTWSLVGVYKTAKPLGRRCYVQYGGDIVLLSVDGFIPLAQALPSYQLNTQKVSLSNKINNTVTESAVSYSANFGWQAVLLPEAGFLLFNIPVAENTTSYQYVMNTITRAWCKFTAWNANCWEYFKGNLYFGTNGKVCKAWSGESDNGANIEGDAKSAFNYFGTPGKNKLFTMVRPVIVSDGSIYPAMDTNIDFEDRAPSSTPTFSGSLGAVWNVDSWDVGSWGGSLTINKDWQSVTGHGYCAALRIKISSNVPQVYWTATDYQFKVGGVI